MNGNEHLWRQFEKLGEMMGDGLHHEPDETRNFGTNITS